MSVSLTDKIVVCRKQHLCDWCGEHILKGEKAHYGTGIFEDHFYSGHQHMECNTAIHNSDCYSMVDGYMAYDQKRGKTMTESHQ